MATYAVLGANNAVQQVPIQTWSDTCYVLFGMAHRDLVNSVDQTIANDIRPRFNQIGNQPLKDDVPLAEAIRDQFVALNSDLFAILNFNCTIDQEKARYDYQWNTWSQLLSPQFLVQVLAYAIHALALKVWDLIDDISTKRADFSNFYMEISRQRDKGVPVADIEYADGAKMQGYITPLIYLRALGDIQEMSGVTILFSNSLGSVHLMEVERYWEDDNGKDFELHIPQNLAQDPSTLRGPALMVTLSRIMGVSASDLGCQYMAAIELMVHEAAAELVIRSRPDQIDLTWLGFKKSENGDGIVHRHERVAEYDYWHLSREQVVGDGAVLILQSDGTVKTLTQMVEDFPIFNKLYPDRTLLPKEILFTH